ncbi:MAG: hypothetical protein U5K30_14115 [Acidimicrobiales bacterium]|nr:hypothetical protein [Acidimicrobiales bacterium]
MDVIYETAFEEWVDRRRPSIAQQLQVLDLLAEVASETITLDDLVQVPRSSAFQAQLADGDETIVVEFLVGDDDWCIVSYLGNG